MKKFLACFAILASLTMTCFAGAVDLESRESFDGAGIEPCATGTWSSDTVTVPGTNGSGFSATYNTKLTSVKTASFHCTKKTHDRNFDARLVNSDNEARSSWARNLDVGKTYHVSENSSIATNHYYYCEVSSDLLTSGDTDVTIYFSADNVSW